MFVFGFSYKLALRNSVTLCESNAYRSPFHCKLTKQLQFKFGSICSSQTRTIIMETLPSGVFDGKPDIYNGVTIDSIAERENNSTFADKLKKSLRYWHETNRRGVWFKVHTSNADWVPYLVQNGFDFHHARQGYVMMFKWLPKNEPANIPECPHTMIGVGGLVINNRNEILVVSEKCALVPNSWKLPGGYVEPSEDLIDAAIREVKEETGIETIYDTLLNIRHAHHGRFGCSDLYIVIGLLPKTTDIRRCEREIAKVKWMPLEEYLNHPNVHETNRHFLRSFQKYKRGGIKVNCVKVTHNHLQRVYDLYTIETADNRK